jgi:hypothetical protein
MTVDAFQIINVHVRLVSAVEITRIALHQPAFYGVDLFAVGECLSDVLIPTTSHGPYR